MSNEMLDKFTRHQIFLQRFATGEANKFDPFLVKADDVIVLALGKQGEKIANKTALAKVIKEITEGVGKAGAYGEYVAQLETDLSELAEVETAFTVRTMQTGVEVVVASPELAGVIRAAYTVPMGLGGTLPPLLNGFINQLTTQEVTRINNVIRTGFSEGQTVAEMTRIIRGTRANRFNDGILATTQRNAYAIARTSVNHMATQARNEVYAENDDILDGVEWSSTLDNKTSNICRFYDGKIFPTDSGPRPPAHVSCRSAILPAVKKELSIFAGNEERISVGADGPKVVTASKYHTWLKTQPAAFQGDVLGIQKAKLFRDGGLSPDKFRKLTSDNFGKPLTLSEIKAKDATAWDKANLD